MEIGGIRGLTVDANYDERINDLYRADEMNRRTQAMNESKAKMFADDMEFNNAMNQFDNPRIKDYAKKTISEIGKFVSENPDWSTNVNKRMWINMKKKELKDNPDLMRGIASDNAFKQMNADLAEVAKNPQQYDQGAYDMLLEQRNNYLKFGNQKGEEAAMKEGAQPFIYQKPQEFVPLTETFLKSGALINPSLIIRGSGIGEITKTADPKHIDAVTNELLQRHGRQISIEAGKIGLNTQKQIYDWVKNQVEAGVKSTYDPGDLTAAFDMQYKKAMLDLAGRKQASKETPTGQIEPWDDLHNPKKTAGIVPVDLVTKVVGDTPEAKVVSNTGKEVDLTGYKVQHTGKYITDKNNVRRFITTIDLPESDATELGIYSPNSTEIEGDLTEEGKQLSTGLGGKIEGASKGISAEFLGKAVVRGERKNPTGEGSQKIIRVTTSIPVDKNNGTMRQLYNAHAQPAKLSTVLTEEEVGGSRAQSNTWNGIPVGSTGMYDGKKVRITGVGKGYEEIK